MLLEKIKTVWSTVVKLISKILFLVDGKWGRWGQYSACTKTCGTGTQRRKRKCNNPSPSHGGEHCIGSDNESIICNTNRCSGKFSNLISSKKN